MDKNQRSFLSKLLRGIAITLMVLTVVLTILSAAGTVCVAYRAEKFKEMLILVPYKPLYKILLVISFAAGIWGIPVIRSLIKGNLNAYRNTFTFLVIGGLSAGVQMTVSQMVRGNSAPVNIRFYVTALTLAIFLFFRFTPLRNIVNFSQEGKTKSSNGLSAGIALIICSIITLTTPIWLSSTHISENGDNWVNIYNAQISTIGCLLILTGITLIFSAIRSLRKTKKPQNLIIFNQIRN